jgi:hypothetical protein
METVNIFLMPCAPALSAHKDNTVGQLQVVAQQR